MIRPSQIDADAFIKMILDDSAGNVNAWWRLVEIVYDYVPPFLGPDTRPTRVSLKCGNSFLRDLGWGHSIWDIHYGEASELNTPEGALLALMTAPVPPWLLPPAALPLTPET